MNRCTRLFITKYTFPCPHTYIIHQIMFQWGACWELHSAFDCFDCLHSRIRANLLLFTQNRAPQSLIRMDCLHFPRCTERIKYNSTFLIYSRSCAKKNHFEKIYLFFHWEINSLSNNHYLTRNVQSF